MHFIIDKVHFLLLVDVNSIPVLQLLLTLPYLHY